MAAALGSARRRRRSRSGGGLRLCPAAQARAVSPRGCRAGPRARRFRPRRVFPGGRRGRARLRRCRSCRSAAYGGRLALSLAHQRRDAVRVRRRRGASSAAMMRGRSMAGRFWLSLNLPSQPARPRSRCRQSPSASPRDRAPAGRSIRHGAASRASCRADSRRSRSRSHSGVVDRARRAVGVHAGVVPGRHRRPGRVPARRDIGVRPGEDRQRLAAAIEIGGLRVGPREMALQIELRRRGARQETGSGWRSCPPAPCVTSSPKSWRSICAISTSSRGLGEMTAADRPMISPHCRARMLSRDTAPARCRAAPTPESTNIPPEPRLIQTR